MTINAVCGSGLKAVMLPRRRSATATTRSASPAGRKHQPRAARPARSRGASGRRLEDGRLDRHRRLFDIYNRYHIGITTKTSARSSSSAATSRCARARLAAEGGGAQKGGSFKDEIVPFPIAQKKATDVFAADELIDRAASARRARRLKRRSTRRRHRRRRNASGLNDGAAAVVVVTRSARSGSA